VALVDAVVPDAKFAVSQLSKVYGVITKFTVPQSVWDGYEYGGCDYGCGRG